MIILILIIAKNYMHTWSNQGIWKSAGKIGKKWNFVSEKCDFCQKMQISAILAQKCKIMDFGHIVHNNAILLKWCNLVGFLLKSVGLHPRTFPDALSSVFINDC